MNRNAKVFANGRSHAMSCLALIAAIGANVLMFCILAMARTIPLLSGPEEYESVRIVSLELPASTSAAGGSPAAQETLLDVIQLGPEPMDTELPQPVTDMASSTFPRLAESAAGGQDISFKLPGLPVRSSNLSLLSPVVTAPEGNIGKPASALKIDRLPSKIAGHPPLYPQWARRGNLEAVVTLRFIVTTEGAVEDVKIHEINGDERFGEEAVRAVSQWGFSPAIRAGRPIPCWCSQKISFRFTP